MMKILAGLILAFVGLYGIFFAIFGTMFSYRDTTAIDLLLKAVAFVVALCAFYFSTILISDASVETPRK